MKKLITKIEAQKKNKNRVNIYINEEFAFACSTELVYYHSLSKGCEVDEEKLLEIAEADNYITAKSLALKYVERSLKTCSQVEEYLIKKEYNPKIISRVLEFMREYKFLDDEYFAKAFATQNMRNEGRGNVRHKLIKKGISESIIDNTLEEFTENQEIETASKLAAKKARLLTSKERDVRKVKLKLNTFLISKGYNFDIVSYVIKNIDFDELYSENAPELDEEATEKAEEKKLEELMTIATSRYEKLKKSESDSMKVKKKLYDFLMRKGYNYEEIKRAVNYIINGEDYI